MPPRIEYPLWYPVRPEKFLNRDCNTKDGLLWIYAILSQKMLFATGLQPICTTFAARTITNNTPIWEITITNTITTTLRREK